MKLKTNENSPGQGKVDFQRAIGAACFRFRAISVLPVILLIFFVFDPIDAGSANPILNILGFLIALIGAATRGFSVGYAKPFTSGRENYLKAESLNTRGAYSIVRNPLYIGNFLIYNGVLVAYSSPEALVLFNIFFFVNYYFIILAEENYLARQFGDEFREYRRAVPKVIPRFALYQKNERPKEKDTTCYWVLFYAVSLLLKQYKINDGVIDKFYWHAVPVLGLFALNLMLSLSGKSRSAKAESR
jgi:protein-S-isoprenylcysteine O-methyltransferase Ste14